MATTESLTAVGHFRFLRKRGRVIYMKKARARNRVKEKRMEEAEDSGSSI